MPRSSEDYTCAYSPNGTILVTGGAGFIGSHVVHLLRSKYPKYRILVLDNIEYTASKLSVPPGVELVQGDIQDPGLLTRLLKTGTNSTYESKGCPVDTVMHFAAQTYVDNSFGNSLTFTMTNTYGTHVLLEACRNVGTVRRFVHVSTDEVYGDTSINADIGLCEGSHLDPTNPYSAAKAGAEMMCRAYITSFGMPIIITRGNNVYGPRQFPEKLVPKFVLLLARGNSLPIHGDGSSLRSYLYVDDVARAFDLVLHYGKVGDIYNVGSDSERSVMEVASDIVGIFSMIHAVTGQHGTQTRTDTNTDTNADTRTQCTLKHVKDRAFNDRRYFIGSQKLKALGWKPEVEWEDGLRKTVEWYMDEDITLHWNEKDIEFSLSQI